MQVCLVEDDAAAAKVVGALLKREGFAVRVFKDAASFFASPVEADLLLVDLLLPGGFDGFKVCENVRKDPKLRTVPIIVMTGLAWRGEGQLSRELMQRFGVAVLLHKPFGRVQLMAGVDKVLPGWQKRVTPPPPPPAPKPEAAKEKPLEVARPNPIDVKPISKALAAAMPNLERTSPRTTQRFSVEFANVEAFVREYTENISAGGMFIKASAVPKVFSEISVVLHLPDGKPPVEVEGVVVHATPNAGFGVQLKKANSEAKKRWEALLESGRPAKVDPSDPNARVIALFNFSAAKTTEIGRMLGLLWRPQMVTITVGSWDELFRYHQMHFVLLDVSHGKSPLLDVKEIKRFFAHFAAPLVIVGDVPAAISNLRERYPSLVFAPAITSDKLLSKLGKLLHVPVRNALRIPVRLHGLLGQHACTVADLSLTGARLEIGRAVEVGHVSRLHVELRDDISVSIDVSVRWVREIEGLLQAGVSFEHIDADHMQVLETFVDGKSLLVRGLAAIREHTDGKKT